MQMTCPQCHSQWVIASAVKNLGEKLLTLVGRQPYRCKSCTERFFRFTSRRAHRQFLENRARRIVGHALVARVAQHT